MFNNKKKNITYPSFGECSICLEEMFKNKEIYTLKCNHTFHKKCIFDWFEKNKGVKYSDYTKYDNIPITGNCPICRKYCNEMICSTAKFNTKCCVIF